MIGFLQSDIFIILKAASVGFKEKHWISFLLFFNNSNVTIESFPPPTGINTPLFSSGMAC